MEKNVATFTPPKFSKRHEEWRLFLAGSSGRTVQIRWFKGWLILWMLILVAAVGSAGYFCFLHANLREEHDRLHTMGQQQVLPSPTERKMIAAGPAPATRSPAETKPVKTEPVKADPPEPAESSSDEKGPENKAVSRQQDEVKPEPIKPDKVEPGRLKQMDSQPESDEVEPDSPQPDEPDGVQPESLQPDKPDSPQPGKPEPDEPEPDSPHLELESDKMELESDKMEPDKVEPKPDEAKPELNAVSKSDALPPKEPAVEPEVPAPPEKRLVVDIDNFKVSYIQRRRILNVSCVVRNMSSNRVSGHAILILKPDKRKQRKWLTLPPVKLVSGRPTGKATGETFSISKFKTLKFQAKRQWSPKRFKTATVFVFAETGELFLEKDFPIEME